MDSNDVSKYRVCMCLCMSSHVYVCVSVLCICLSVCYLFFADTFASSAAVNKVKQESKRKRMLVSVRPCNTLAIQMTSIG